ncbi:hypothetical protein [Stenotrophomonas terrae]|uniref:hypothetical protein n=1 Tax=Stenotrophomonas terrae TaxID=405446 RepID=UPI00128F6B29|nr:hypothetical protein [Stenotrophomonas terrae]
MPSLPRPSSSSTALSSLQAGSDRPQSAQCAGAGLSRRQQLAQLESCTQQELAQLRITRDQQTGLQPRDGDSSQWLSSSVDWDLAVP